MTHFGVVLQALIMRVVKTPPSIITEISVHRTPSLTMTAITLCLVAFVYENSITLARKPMKSISCGTCAATLVLLEGLVQECRERKWMFHIEPSSR